ncbi:toxin 3FTx-Lei1-like [Ahaetulla prasina]|uniref:Three finger toxin 2 n=1 Tax=Ahaetulla prasina TaxID=499056 RepID=A0A193CHL5_9SAUR
MKTLLLALAVVAFVCPDSVNPVVCLQCNSKTYWKCLSPKNCPAGENICYFLRKYDGTSLTDWVKGCAKKCPIPKAGETVKCCMKKGCLYRSFEVE